MLDFLSVAQQCAPTVHADTMMRIVRTESSFNPYAIGVVGGRLDRQPRSMDEAVATAQELERKGFNYSVGMAQVNKRNFSKYGLTLKTAFEICPNLKAGGAILQECYLRAFKVRRDEQAALRDAFSCYYSGNFITGYKEGYVLKVVSGGKAPKGATVVTTKASTEGSPRAIAIRANGRTVTARSEDTPSETPQTTSVSALLF